MKLLRRNLLAGISASLLSVFGQAGAEAAAGPTIKAKKVGQRIVFRGYTYVCIKSKGKLIWKKGAKVLTPSPSATPSASPTPTPTPSQSASVAPLTFVAKVSEVGMGQTKIVVVKPASGASFSVALTRTSGAIVVVSAMCTHLGCTVAAAGSELQCPCHGSAFNPDSGAVINGPATLPLRKYISSEEAGSIFIRL